MWTVQWNDGDRFKTKRFENEADARTWYERIVGSAFLRNVKLHAPNSY